MNSRELVVEPGMDALIEGFRAPHPLPFGQVMAPVMYQCEYRDGAWQSGHLLPYGPIAIDPSIRGLHYAHTLYEGMKAFRWADGGVRLFRPLDHWSRMAASAARLCMPEIPPERFMEGLQALAGCCAPITPRGAGQCLYLRPLMFATDAKLGLDVSETFRFMVIASPSGAYYARPITLLVEREETRAAGSLGAAKVSGNYAASTFVSQRVKTLGYDQPLWLDPRTRRNVEELSGMNLFAVIDATVHTPALSGTFLAGITRDSVLALARGRGLTTVERVMPVDELIDDLARRRCSEVFATGTGAGVCAVQALGDGDEARFELADVPGPVTIQLAEALAAVQQGLQPDERGWLVAVPH